MEEFKLTIIDNPDTYRFRKQLEIIGITIKDNDLWFPNYETVNYFLRFLMNVPYFDKNFVISEILI